MCGENDLQHANLQYADGTPPRVWGKLNFARQRSQVIRYTPTCVGKTYSSIVFVCYTKVHPHVCGENVLVQRRYQLRQGTPPRVWGKRLVWLYVTDACRYTPTCVGKTNHTLTRILVIAVHPHVCGENGARGRMLLTVPGTPPRVWGKLSCRRSTAMFVRYTPTCVGKTVSQGFCSIFKKVHPHVCGENIIIR